MPTERDLTDSLSERGRFQNAVRWLTRATGLRIFGAIGLDWQEVTPVTAESTTISTGVGGIYLDHTATIASHTLTMPAAPEDGSEITIASRSAVTSLTHDPNVGQYIRGALTALTANGFAKYRYRASDAYWHRIG